MFFRNKRRSNYTRLYALFSQSKEHLLVLFFFFTCLLLKKKKGGGGVFRVNWDYGILPKFISTLQHSDSIWTSLESRSALQHSLPQTYSVLPTTSTRVSVYLPVHSDYKPPLILIESESCFFWSFFSFQVVYLLSEMLERSQVLAQNLRPLSVL